MMAKKLPPMHLVSIFEAAARLESFKLASEELFITPSAVSHQIKSLEQHVGFSLFTRKSRGVTLNSAGKLYLHYVKQSLEILEKGHKKVISKFSSPSLKLSTFSTMATNVILPELGLFQNSHPEIDIRIETGLNITDFRYEDFDLAIRIGHGEWPNVIVKKILDIDVAPLCTADFAEKHQLKNYDQINDIPLIDLTSMENIWQQWAQIVKVEEKNFNLKLTFNNYEATLQAAEQGLGLCLGLLPIENALLKRGSLINPFGETFAFGRGMYAVYREEDQDRHDIQCFLNWLQERPILQKPSN